MFHIFSKFVLNAPQQLWYSLNLIRFFLLLFHSCISGSFFWIYWRCDEMPRCIIKLLGYPLMMQPHRLQLYCFKLAALSNGIGVKSCIVRSLTEADMACVFGFFFPNLGRMLYPSFELSSFPQESPVKQIELLSTFCWENFHLKIKLGQDS